MIRVNGDIGMVYCHSCGDRYVKLGVLHLPKFTNDPQVTSLVIHIAVMGEPV